MPQPSTETLIAVLETAMKEDNYGFLKETFAGSRPEDIAEAISAVGIHDAIKALNQISGRLYFQVFEHINLDMQVQLVSRLNRKQTIKILEELSPDDRVDILDRLPEKTVDTLLPLMAQAEREDAKRLLQYGDDTAGTIMTTEYATLPINYTASEALQYLQKIAPNSETIYYLYIIDKQRVLKGILSLKDLVLAYPYEHIQDIMNTDFIAVYVDIDKEDVAQTFVKYDLMAIPVINREEKMVGIVTVDDAMDVVVEEQTEDVHRMGALEPVETPYLKTAFWKLAQNRGLWLMILFFGVSFTGAALKHFHATLEAAIALVYFVPLIVSSGGNTGSQSVTLITRALAVGEVQSKDLIAVILREGLMGMVLGIFLGSIGLMCAFFLQTPAPVCWSVGIALFSVVLAGSLIGGVLLFF
ncbi:MAG: magnesium transporter [Bdellovibrionota bacterium]